MTMAEQTKEIQPKEKQEVKTPSEQLSPGPVFTPAVDILEDENAITLVADMPGVPSENLNIDLRDDVLTLTGVPSISLPPKEEYLLKEYEIGKYFRQFTLSERIAQGKIDANLSDGVLRLTLPKVEAAKPRRIEITEG
jgi:HSP20 family molecular chaperone IbpA